MAKVESANLSKNQGSVQALRFHNAFSQQTFYFIKILFVLLTPTVYLQPIPQCKNSALYHSIFEQTFKIVSLAFSQTVGGQNILYLK